MNADGKSHPKTRAQTCTLPGMQSKVTTSPRVRVYRNPEGGYLEEYSIDSEMFFTETLPALKESNEILEEEYND